MKKWLAIQFPNTKHPANKYELEIASDKDTCNENFIPKHHPTIYLYSTYPSIWAHNVNKRCSDYLHLKLRTRPIYLQFQVVYMDVPLWQSSFQMLTFKTNMHGILWMPRTLSIKKLITKPIYPIICASYILNLHAYEHTIWTKGVNCICMLELRRRLIILLRYVYIHLQYV